MGISAVALPGGEIVPSAQRGVIDAAEWSGPADDLNLGLNAVWKNYYLQGLHRSTDVREVIINKDVWGGLEPDVQETFRTAALASMAETYAFNVARNYRWEPTPEGRKTVSGGVVAFYSLEMSAEQLAMRILSDASGVSSDNFTPGHVARAVLEGIAEALAGFVRNHSTAPGECRPFGRVIATGNAVRRNPLLADCLARAFRLPVFVPEQEEEAAYGAAILAGVRTGLWPDLTTAGRRFRLIRLATADDRD